MGFRNRSDAAQGPHNQRCTEATTPCFLPWCSSSPRRLRYRHVATLPSLGESVAFGTVRSSNLVDHPVSNVSGEGRAPAKRLNVQTIYPVGMSTGATLLSQTPATPMPGSTPGPALCRRGTGHSVPHGPLCCMSQPGERVMTARLRRLEAQTASAAMHACRICAGDAPHRPSSSSETLLSSVLGRTQPNCEPDTGTADTCTDSASGTSWAVTPGWGRITTIMWRSPEPCTNAPSRRSSSRSAR